MSINYDRIKAGTAVINEFDKKLRVLCEEYQQKLSEACPEDIHYCIGDAAKPRYCIQLRYNTLEEALGDGFGNVHEADNGSLHLSKEVDGMKIVTVVYK